MVTNHVSGMSNAIKMLDLQQAALQQRIDRLMQSIFGRIPPIVAVLPKSRRFRKGEWTEFRRDDPGVKETR